MNVSSTESHAKDDLDAAPKDKPKKSAAKYGHHNQTAWELFQILLPSCWDDLAFVQRARNHCKT